MAVLKLSQIASSAAGFVTGDFLVGVQTGTTDVLFSKAQIYNPPLVVTEAANPSTSTLTLTGATALTTSQPVLNMTQTWNNAATTFTAIKFNVTDTASNASSLLMDLQRNGTSIFSVGTNNSLNRATITLPTFSILEAEHLFQTQGGVASHDFNSGGITTGSGTVLVWSDNSDVRVGTNELSIRRDAANILGIVNNVTPATAMGFRVYNTFTDSSNYERGALDWKTTANTFRIRSENAGTGTNRIIAIDGFDKAGAAANTDLPSGTWALIHDTSGATVKLVYNLSGTLKTVALV